MCKKKTRKNSRENSRAEKIDTLLYALDDRRLRLQSAVGLAAHGEQERESDVESLEMRGSGPGHRKQARLDPDVRAAHNDEAQVTGKMRLVLGATINRLLTQDLLTQGREERYVP